MYNSSKENLTDSILKKIETERITPTSEWHFRVHHAILWIPGTLVTLLGACAWAGILFGWEHAGFEYERFIAPTKLQFLLKTMPLLWIGSFVLFTGVIVQTLRLTPKGYRFDSRKMLGASLLISIGLGTLLYIIDTRGYKNPVIRYPVEQQHKAFWSHPETGHLAGLIDIENNVVFLTDLNNNQWILDTSFLPTTTKITDDTMFRFIGTQIDNENFLVCVLLPWNLSLKPLPLPPKRTPTLMLFSTSTGANPCEMFALKPKPTY